MARDWEMVTNKQDRNKMLNIANMSRNLSIKSVLLVQSVFVLYAILRFLMMQNAGRQLFFPAFFPYNWTKTPLYELSFVGQSIASLYATNTYTAVDTFIAMLVLHTCGQLSNLRRELTNLQVATKAEFEKKLKKIVEKHEYLNRWEGKIGSSEIWNGEVLMRKKNTSSWRYTFMFVANACDWNLRNFVLSPQ